MATSSGWAAFAQKLRRPTVTFARATVTTGGIFLINNMGKRSIAKLFAAVPVTATIIVNTNIYQDKNNIQLEPQKTNTNYYEVDKKYKSEPSLELAIDKVPTAFPRDRSFCWNLRKRLNNNRRLLFLGVFSS